PEEALPIFAAARETAAKTIGADHWQYAAALAYGAETLHALGRIDDAIDAALAADAITRGNTRAMIRAISEAQALRLLDAQETGGLDRALAFAIERPNERRVRATWDALIRSRAMLLDELAARRHALARKASPEVEAARAAYAEAAARSANLRVRGAAQDSAALIRPLLATARADAERAERALAALSIDYRENADRAAVGLDDVAKALPRGAALVAYAIYAPAEAWNRPRAAVDRGERRFAAFVLRGGAAPQVVALPAVAEVDRLVERWRDEAARGALGRKSAADVDAAYRAAAAPLAAAVWAPLAPLVASAKTVYIVPEGTLSTVNFATLPGKGGRYLLETGPLFRYLSAERGLAAPPARGAAGQGLLVLGGAAFDAGARPRDAGDEAAAVVAMLQPPRFRGDESEVCRGFEAVRFAPLPASGAEAQRIAELWGASIAGDAAAARIERLEGAAATEAAFRRDAPGRRVLHLATHGFFLGGACLRAADGRGIGGLAPLSPRARRTVNPLLFSGLAFAGANAHARAASGDDDGVLTAEEIATLDLGGVDWAVLSACDTGLGDVRIGEGVLGLRRAFQVAGARTVVMSLWPVQDER
ncbi:MAG: CHAT domain-containing protein, partial [Candidatus Polarisedimenticolia bacterium]